MADLFRYVALGDSTAVGTGANTDGGYPERLFQRLKSSGVNAGILNLGRQGATSRDVVQLQIPKALSTAPSLVTLGVGTNDLWRMVPVGSFQMNLKLIADALAKANIPVVVPNIVDLSLAPIAGLIDALLHIPRQQFLRRLDEMNSMIGLLSRRPNFQVVDLCSVSREDLPQHPEYFCPDGFHPSAAGYDRWAEIMWPAVERIVKRV